MLSEIAILASPPFGMRLGYREPMPRKSYKPEEIVAKLR